MLDLKTTTDNIFIKLVYKKSAIIVAKGDKGGDIKPKTKMEKVEILGIGDKVKEMLPTLQVGDLILLRANLVLEPYNTLLGEKDPATDESCTEIFSFIKGFDVVSILK